MASYSIINRDINEFMAHFGAIDVEFNCSKSAWGSIPGTDDCQSMSFEKNDNHAFISRAWITVRAASTKKLIEKIYQFVAEDSGNRGFDRFIPSNGDFERSGQYRNGIKLKGDQKTGKPENIMPIYTIRKENNYALSCDLETIQEFLKDCTFKACKIKMNW